MKLENKPMAIPHKLPDIKPSIFATINTLVHQYQPVNLAQGFPGFSPDKKLLNEVTKALHSGKNQYAPLAGIFSLRETLCQKQADQYGYTYHPETEITLTAGATQAIFTAIAAVVRPDDEVIVFKPAYDCYEPAIALNGGKSIQIALHAPEYKIDWNEVKAAINPKTRMIIINNPHNPSGRCLSDQDLKELSALVKDTNIIILSDEVYEHITYDGKKHQSVARYPDLAERAFLTYSFGKTFHVTGWKMGYCFAPKALMDEFKKVHQYNVFCVNHPMQVALNAYLQEPEHYLQLPDFFQQKRDFFFEAIRHSKFEGLPAEGTYFQTLSYRAISDKKDVAFVKELIVNHHIAAIPISVFHKDNTCEKMIRFCFAKNEDTLKKAADILNSL